MNNYLNPFDNPSTFTTSKSLMLQTGGYMPMFARTWQTSLQDHSIVDKFMDVTDGGREVNQVAMATVSPDFITPSPMVSGQINVAGGFNETRFIFMISIEEHKPHSSHPKTSIISGYTDRAAYSSTGQLDPETKMYINSVTLVSAFGALKPLDSYHVLSSNVAQSYGTVMHPDPYNPYVGLNTIRPADVLRNMKHMHDSEVIVADGQNMVTEGQQVVSRRTNAVAGRYLSSIIDPLLGATISSNQVFPGDDGIGMNYGYGGVFGGPFEQARSRIREPSLTDNDLTREFRRRFQSFLQHGYITWMDLTSMVPDLDSKTVVSTLADNPVQQNRNAQAVDSANWDSATTETLIATICSQSISAFMANALIAYIECEITNATVDGGTMINILNAQAFDPRLDIQRVTTHFRHQIESELMPMLTRNGALTVSVSLRFDLMVDALISVSIDGGPWIEYTSPVFCDALFSPILTTNTESCMNVARDTSHFINAVTGAV